MSQMPGYNLNLGAGPDNPKVEPQQVLQLRDDLKFEFRGLHLKMKELEAIRYLEDDINLPAAERPTGLEIRTGMSGDLVEKIKAALTTNLPSIKVKGTREGVKAQENSAKRELFWREWLKSLVRPVPILAELIDAQAGLGMGVLKAVYFPWPETPRTEPETPQGDKDYLDRRNGFKRLWGPPFKVISVHPMTWMPRLGSGNQVEESIEESLKSKNRIYGAYGIPLGRDGDEVLSSMKQVFPSMEGQPTVEQRSLPVGQSTANMVRVTEYLVPGVIRQVFIEDRLVLEEDDPNVAYFPVLGRSTSSKDPDKMGVSVADVLRHIEPIVNRSLTRMAEATDLLVRKRMAVELPEGSTDYYENPTGLGESNDPVPRSFNFDPESATALPPGAKIQDPFDGAENVYGAMPFIQLLMTVASQHGVSPIFKGENVGASGYDNNSLYLMARAQFNYLLENLQFALGQLIDWLEQAIVRKVQREVWIGDLSLSPKDIADWPATFEVTIEPFLPQNLMATGQFWDLMWTKGHTTRQKVRENGLKDEDPQRTARERMEEDLQDMLRPILYQDVLRTAGVIPTEQPAQPSVLGPDGQPIGGQNPQAGQHPQAQTAQANSSEAGSTGAASQAGSPRQPPMDPGQGMTTASVNGQ